MHSIAWNTRVKELSRMGKSELGRIYRLHHPHTIYLSAPPERWNKDELVNDILRTEFPDGGLVQPSYEQLGGTGSWCVTGTHDPRCTCSVAPGVVTEAAS